METDWRVTPFRRIGAAIALAVAAMGLIAFGLANTVGGPASAATIRPHALGASSTFSLSISGQPTIPVESWSWGATQTSTASSGGAAAGKVKYAEFSIIKQTDQSTPVLWQSLVSGSVIKQMVFDASDPTSGDQLQIKFGLTRIESINWSGGGGEELPKEEITFSVASSAVSYTSQPGTP